MKYECASCSFSQTTVAPDRSMIRECRRYPPHTAFISTPQGAGPATFFPVVKNDWYCGDYSPVIVGTKLD